VSVTPLSAVRLLAVAVALYSRWPATAGARARTRDAEAVAGARAWLPVVGLAVAVPASLAYALAGLMLPHAIAVLTAMLVALLLSGAVHERGLARWMDQGEDAPSSARAGVLALIAVTMLVLARLEILSTIDPLWIAVTLVCAAAFSRGCALLAVVSLPAHAAFRGPGAAGLLWALLWALVPTAAAIAWTGETELFVTASALALLVGALMRQRMRRRLRAGLLPGEHAIGATQALSEIAYFVGVLATLSVPEDAGADADL